MNPKWYPGYFLDPQHWSEWMPDAMDQWLPSSPMQTPPAPPLGTWPTRSPKPSYALFTDSLEGPRPKSLEEQRAELPSLLPYVPPSKPNSELLWTGLVPAPPQPEPLPNSPLPANAAKSLPPLFPRWPDYVMTTAGVPAKVAGLDIPDDEPASSALPVQWPAVSTEQTQAMPSAPAVPYTESADYWGAGPKAAADSLLVPYLASVPPAPESRADTAYRTSLERWSKVKEINRKLLFGDPNGTFMTPVDENGRPLFDYSISELREAYPDQTHPMIEAANSLAALATGGIPFATRGALGMVGGKLLTPAETRGLTELFGKRPDGAKALLDRLAQGPVNLPANVTRQTLEKYAQIAQNAIDLGKDKIGTQALRLEAIRRLLSR